LGATASNVALATMLSAVAIEWSYAGQCRRLRGGQGAEFGHEGNQGGGTEGADALDLPEPLDFRGEVGRAGDFGGHERLDLIGLLAQEGDGSGHQSEQLFVGERFRQIIVLGDLNEQMRAVFDEGGKFLLERIWEAKRFWMECLGKSDGFKGVGSLLCTLLWCLDSFLEVNAIQRRATLPRTAFRHRAV
jgi:hypothetical protein